MEEINPLIIGNLVHAKNREIKGIWLKVVNKPGVLAKIFSILAEYGINVLVTNFSHIVEEGESGTLFIVADFATTNIEEVKKRIEKLEIVEDSEIVEPQFDALLVDLYHFPIVDDKGKRLLIFTEYNMESLVVRLREHFKEGGLAFLYHQGLLTGLSLAETYKKWKIDDLKQALYVNFLRAHALGRYRAEISKYIKKRESLEIQIKIHDMWECLTARRYGIKEPSCHFERGVIAGIIEGYVGKRIKLKEVKCVAKGDPHCLLATKITLTQ